MNDISIRIKGVGKSYRIDQGTRPNYQTLRDQIVKTISSPMKRLKNSESSSKWQNPKDPENRVWALKDISFDIHQGELVGLIGPNGAGKSTLLKILTRVTEPTVGSIDIYGRVGSLLEVGTGFHKDLTGRDNVYLNGAILGMNKREIDQKFDEIVAFSEVEQFIDTQVKFYSSGMTVRLAFAVAAHLEPEILLVDEVLAVGDAAFQKKCLSKMEKVGESGRTVIFVSHHMPSITRLCEKVILLEQGQLIESGPSDQVVANYLASHLGMSAYHEYLNPKIAPGSEIVRLAGVRVINRDGETNYSYAIRDTIGIEMTYDVLRSGYALYPHFSVHNESEVYLFTSIDTDPEWRGQVRPVGRYKSIGWIPGNLLTEGVMSIGAAMRTEFPHTIHFYERDAVAFQVSDRSHQASARVDFVGKMRGVVRPNLRWTTQYFSTAEISPVGSTNNSQY
jgi:lipopolysaccharide transport system ATP-binding protein